MKLYRVLCRGMRSSSSGVAHGDAYVVARNSEEAYQIVRKSLDERNLGFTPERELDRVELLAEQVDYPDCRHKLYVSQNSD